MSSLRDLVDLDLGVGIGLRAAHYAEVLGGEVAVDWFEVVSENFLDTGGRPVQVLDAVAECYPIVTHGVSLNLGSVDPLDRSHVAGLKTLRDRIGARFVSDHVCWTGVDGVQLHDLLPLPYTEESLRLMAAKVNQVQQELEAPLVLENPSTYLEFAASTLSEPEFLRALSDETGCGLLIDVNNAYVCARNHGFDPESWLEAIPWDRVVQFHLAGHQDLGTHLLDSHDAPVCDAVWRLYERACELSGGRSTLIEWDADIPPLATMLEEVAKARAILDRQTPFAEFRRHA